MKQKKNNYFAFSFIAVTSEKNKVKSETNKSSIISAQLFN